MKNPSAAPIKQSAARLPVGRLSALCLAALVGSAGAAGLTPEQLAAASRTNNAVNGLTVAIEGELNLGRNLMQSASAYPAIFNRLVIYKPLEAFNQGLPTIELGPYLATCSRSVTSLDRWANTSEGLNRLAAEASAGMDQLAAARVGIPPAYLRPAFDQRIEAELKKWYGDAVDQHNLTMNQVNWQGAADYFLSEITALPGDLTTVLNGMGQSSISLARMTLPGLNAGLNVTSELYRQIASAGLPLTAPGGAVLIRDADHAGQLYATLLQLTESARATGAKFNEVIASPNPNWLLAEQLMDELSAQMLALGKNTERYGPIIKVHGDLLAFLKAADEMGAAVNALTAARADLRAVTEFRPNAAQQSCYQTVAPHLSNARRTLLWQHQLRAVQTLTKTLTLGLKALTSALGKKLPTIAPGSAMDKVGNLISAADGLGTSVTGVMARIARTDERARGSTVYLKNYQATSATQNAAFAAYGTVQRSYKEYCQTALKPVLSMQYASDLQPSKQAGAACFDLSVFATPTGALTATPPTLLRPGQTLTLSGTFRNASGAKVVFTKPIPTESPVSSFDPVRGTWSFNKLMLSEGQYSYDVVLLGKPDTIIYKGNVDVRAMDNAGGTLTQPTPASVAVNTPWSISGQFSGNVIDIFVEFTEPAPASPNRVRVSTLDSGGRRWSHSRNFTVPGNYGFKVIGLHPVTKAEIVFGSGAVTVTPIANPSAEAKVTGADPTTILKVGQPASFNVRGVNLNAQVSLMFGACINPSIGFKDSGNMVLSCTPSAPGPQNFGWRPAPSVANVTVLRPFEVLPNDPSSTLTSAHPLTPLILNQAATFSLTGTLLNPSSPPRVSLVDCDASSLQILSATQARFTCTPRVANSKRLFWKAPGTDSTEHELGSFVVTAPVLDDVPALVDCPVRGSGWVLANNSPLHRAGGGVGGADDSFALDMNLNTPQHDSDAGKPVYAVADGVVYRGNGWGGASVGQVLINHVEPDGRRWSSGYLHMSGRTSATNVRRGEQIGVVANVGVPDGNNHLHFAVYAGHNGVRSMNRQPQCNGNGNGNGNGGHVDGMTFVAETVPDNSPIPGSSPFTKTWILKNTGSSTWTSGYCLKPSSGEALSNTPACVTGSVQSGATYEFRVPMTSPPAKPVDAYHKQFWTFSNAQGSKIGSDLWVQIKVGGLAGPTPTLTNAQALTPLILNQAATFSLTGTLLNPTNPPRVSLADCDTSALQILNATQARFTCTPRLAGSKRLFWKAPGTDPKEYELGMHTVALTPPPGLSLQPPAPVKVGQTMNFSAQLSAPAAVQRAELVFTDVNVTEPMTQAGPTSWTRARPMTQAGNNRPYRVVVTLADGQRLQQDGVYTVTPDLPLLSLQPPAPVKVGQTMSFNAQLSAPATVQRAELVFTDVNVTEPMTQAGPTSWTRGRPMTQAGANRPYRVVLTLADGQRLQQDGVYTVTGDDGLLNLQPPAPVKVGQNMSFTAALRSPAAVQRAELLFPDVNVTEPMTQAGPTSWTRVRPMTQAGANRPYRVVLTLADGRRLQQDGVYTVTADDQVLSLQAPAPVKVGQNMSFTAVLRTPANVQRAELLFLDVNVTEPMTQAGPTSWTRVRPMTQAGTNRPYRVVLTLADGQRLQQDGVYTVAPADLPQLRPVLSVPNSVQAGEAWTARLNIDEAIYSASLVFKTGRRIQFDGGPQQWVSPAAQSKIYEPGVFEYQLEVQRTLDRSTLQMFPGGVLEVRPLVGPTITPVITSAPTAEQGKPYNLTVQTSVNADKVTVIWPDIGSEQALRPLDASRTKWEYGNRLFAQASPQSFIVRAYKDGFAAPSGEARGTISVTAPNAALRLLQISGNVLKGERPFFTVAASLSVARVSLLLGNGPAVEMTGSGPNGSEQNFRTQVLAAQSGAVPYVITGLDAQGQMVGNRLTGTLAVAEPGDSLKAPNPIPAEIQQGQAVRWQFLTHQAPNEMWLEFSGTIGKLPLTGAFLDQSFNYPGGDYSYRLMRRDHLGNVFPIQGAAGVLRIKPGVLPVQFTAAALNGQPIVAGAALRFKTGELIQAAVRTSSAVPNLFILIPSVPWDRDLQSSDKLQWGAGIAGLPKGSHPATLHVKLPNGQPSGNPAAVSFSIVIEDNPPPRISIQSASAIPASVKVGQSMNFVAQLSAPAAVQRAELLFPDVNVTEPMTQGGPSSWARARPMTLAGANRPYRMVLTLADGQRLQQDGVYTVLPADLPQLSLQPPAPVKVGQTMSFNAQLSAPSAVQRAELLFPDVNVTEPMTQGGPSSWTRARPMTLAGANRPYRVVLTLVDGQRLQQDGVYTVLPADLPLLSLQPPAPVKVGQTMSFNAQLSAQATVQRAELLFPDVNVTEPMTQTGPTSWTRARPMTQAGSNRPYRVALTLADGQRLQQDGVYTVAPADLPQLSLQAPAPVKAGQNMSFNAQLSTPAAVQRAELLFPDANVTEPMTQTGPSSWTRVRPMSQAGDNRPYRVALTLADGQRLQQDGVYTVMPADLPLQFNIQASPPSVRQGQTMSFNLRLNNPAMLGRAELIFPDANVTEVLTQTGPDSWGRSRTMVQPGNNRPFIIRLLLRDGSTQQASGNYSVTP